MTTATPSTALAAIQPAFTDAERLALVGYRGLTRGAYALDLRQFTTWCPVRSLNLSAVRRADIEGFARDLEARGRARATVTRRLCTIAGFYRYAVEEELLDHSPAVHVRRPRVDYESHAVALDRNEPDHRLVAHRQQHLPHRLADSVNLTASTLPAAWAPLCHPAARSFPLLSRIILEPESLSEAGPVRLC